MNFQKEVPVYSAFGTFNFNRSRYLKVEAFLSLIILQNIPNTQIAPAAATSKSKLANILSS